MKIYIYTIFSFILFALLGCTTKSDTYYNRQFRMIPTMYNVLYNGNLALEEGIQEIENQYQDNYFDILPVEPLLMNDEVKLLGEENPHFDRAEQKAIKAIQRHSMVFDGKQKNKKIDDAYMLLGKARFYNQRFIPSIEAFDHLLINYGETNRRNMAAIWREKANIQLGKHQIAIDNLQKIIAEEKLTKKELSEAQSVMAQAFIDMEQYQNAVSVLKLAGKNTSNKPYRGRYYFITGQLYERLNQKDSAMVYFQKVIDLNRKIPRKLWIEAQFGKARNQQFTPEEKQIFISFLKKLQNQYENKKFLDLLYFQQAITIEQNPKESIDLFLKSLENNTHNLPLKQRTHLKLAELYFSQKKYTNSYTHYDSTLVFIPENTLEHLYIRRKRDNLKEVALQESLVKKVDSILKVTKMTQAQRADFIRKYTDSVKAKSGLSNNVVTDFGTNTKLTTKQSSIFYFDNPTAVAYGKQMFVKQFGNRPLEDNWRWSSLLTQSSTTTFLATQQDSIKVSKQLIDSTISEEEIVSWVEKQNEALYRLAIIYFDKFKDNTLAISSLERILDNNPNAELYQKALYQLYKIYQNDNSQKSIFYKNKLIQDFPSSVYAQALTQNIEITEQELQQKLKELEKLFENQQFSEVLQIIDQQKINYKTTAFAPDWDLLRAKAQGRLEGIIVYKRLLEELIQKYPNTQQALYVQNVLEKLNTDEKQSQFLTDSEASSWKIVYPLSDSKQLVEMKELLETYGLAYIKITQDVYNYTEKWMVLHGFFDKKQGLEFLEKINSDQKNRFFKELFLISSENYSIIQLYKNKDQYK